MTRAIEELERAVQLEGTAHEEATGARSAR